MTELERWSERVLACGRFEATRQLLRGLATSTDTLENGLVTSIDELAAQLAAGGRVNYWIAELYPEFRDTVVVDPDRVTFNVTCYPRIG